MFLTVIDVLSWSLGSSSSNFSMMVRAGWMGTEVKSAFTSYEIMTSSGPSWMPFRCCRKSSFVVYMMRWLSHQGFQDLRQFLSWLVCYSPNTGNYRPEWHPLFVYFWQAIELGWTCPCGIEPSVGHFIHSTLCIYALQDGNELVLVSSSWIIWDGLVFWLVQ